MRCDLHLHSTASDGTDLPQDLPRLAREAELGAIALTDHDTTAGLAACAEAAAKHDLPFVPGIELSADPLLDRQTARATPPRRLGTLHILGYFIDPADEQLALVQGWLHEARQQRNPEMVERLNDLGMKLHYDEVIELAGGDVPATVVGRPHIAELLVRKGYVKSKHEAFARYLGEGGEAYIRKDRLSAEKAIEAIHHAGGLALLAHPVQLGLADHDALEHMVARLRDLGLDGIETHHSDHRPRDVERFAGLADRYELLTCGGSDYHGTRKTVKLDHARVPLDVYHQLREAYERR
ncbi:PHP domain-containing protein [Phycisphaerales bacterium AB-hyl4]|uniref:PHP domain-containing protein n=1 Tax=Natronomicrosphaera hydrolytica TaxID=3242702 RepID=A0ABV4U7I1_9BACT